MIVSESAGLSDIGKKRKKNEDMLFYDDSLGFYVVSDGVGGNRAGEVASRVVVDDMHDYMADSESLKEDSLDDDHEHLSLQASHLLSCIIRANQKTHELSLSHEEYKGMGATVSAVLFTGKTCIAGNVGDSPIYLIHNNQIEMISVFHTVGAMYDKMSPKRAASLDASFRHVITQAMGIRETVEPDICEIQCYLNDYVVICSDGLSNLVSKDEICDVVTSESARDACSKLVNMANSRGGGDNITVIVLKIGDRPVLNNIQTFMKDKLKFVKYLFWEFIRKI